MYLHSIEIMNSLIESLPSCNDKTSDILSKITSLTTEYVTAMETYKQEDRKAKLQIIKDTITASINAADDEEKYCDINEINDFIYFDVCDVYTFKYSSTTDIKLLENFIEFAFESMGIELVAAPVEQTPDEPETPINTTEDKTPPNPTIESNQSPTDDNVFANLEPIALDETDDVIVEEDIEARKKKNVEHMNSVRDNITRATEQVRLAKFKERTDEIAHVISDTHTIVTLIRNGVSNVFNKLTQSEVFLSDVIKMVGEDIGSLTHVLWVRLLIKVEALNRKNKLLRTPKIIIDDAIKNGQIASLDKKDMVYITVCNLEFIASHSPVRPYSIFALIVYMLDYCDKTSSLAISETPEEIVELMSGVYDIFVSNSLKEDFVYDASDDITSLGTLDKWHQKNDIVMMYLNDPNFDTPDGDSNVVDEIIKIYKTRDVLMSTQTLDKSQTTAIHELLNQIETNGSSRYIRKRYEDKDTYVLIAKNVGGFQNICIVADNLGVVSYVNFDATHTYQKNYVQQNASELIKWLKLLMPENSTTEPQQDIVAAPTTKLN